MTKDEIKKALKMCSVDSCTDCPYDNKGLYCCGKLKRDALDLITEQEKDYSKLQEMFANYQLASDKEIRAQVKQAKIDVLNKIKNCREATDSDCYPYLERIVNKLIKEVEK